MLTWFAIIVGWVLDTFKIALVVIVLAVLYGYYTDPFFAHEVRQYIQMLLMLIDNERAIEL